MPSAKCKDILLFSTVVLLIGAIAATITLAVLYTNLLGEENKSDPVTAVTNPVTTVAPVDPVAPFDKLTRRINCFPEQHASSKQPWDITPKQCADRGCQYDLNTNGRPDIPICYMGADIGYKVTSKTSSKDWYIELTLEPIKTTPYVFDPPISKLKFKAQIWNNQHLQIKIEDANKERYEVPFESPLKKDNTATETTADFTMTYSSNPFSFQIKRKSSGAILFDTSIGGFVYSDRFLQIATLLPSSNLYGIGENEHPSLRHDLTRYRTWPMFGRDQGGLGEGTNLYGTHPFYMVLENDGNSHGVFLLNSNAQEFSTIPAPGAIFRTIGGILDLHFNFGPTPNQVVQQQTAMVGRPFIPPYWALGFHLSRYGYNNLSNMEAAVNRTRDAGIPLDVIYADIDHFDARKDFTIDMQNFAKLPEYFDVQRKTEGLRSVIILDPAIPDVPGGGYEPWVAFDSNNTWITWANGSTMIGYVWPDDFVAFPDFLKKSTHQVWVDEILQHFKRISFDGLWIDMNEPANFGTNEEKPFNWPAGKEPWSLKCPTDGYYDAPPYRTWAASFYDDPRPNGRKAMISDKTLCMDARQGENGKYRHYDVHNLYGWSQTPPTVAAIQKTEPGRRGFVLSRSTFAGSGAWAAHWLGDNLATWEHMHRSIVGMLEMSMFGLALTGPDICGFMRQASPEICLRWQQLGAFYPYSRNHNDIDSKDQDPAAMGPDVAEETRVYMLLRYNLLPYMYTLFYHANQDGSAVARPLFFEFPKDQATWGIDRQFMLGSGIMIAPILEEGAESVIAYVPQGTWVNIARGKYDFIDRCDAGKNHKFEINGTAVLVRGGTAMAIQLTKVASGSITTMKTRLNPYEIHAVLDCNNAASGTLFWDDGDSINTIENDNYYFAEYTVEYNQAGQLVITSDLSHVSNDTSVGTALTYSEIKIMGKKLGAKPRKVEVNCKATSDCPTATGIENKNAVYVRFDKPMPFTTDFIVTVTW